MPNSVGEFSFRTREKSLQRLKNETFDLLVIGGGITGAAVARDATSRGLKVALVERRDFAFGTSSRSSKLIHGGLRYLQNAELGLVFEALAERSLLLKTAPHMVRPMPFYLPVYQGDSHGRGLLSLGLWLYDLLALFRTPGFHRGLSRKKILADIPFLRADGLKGGFRYFDASMWDDVLAVETLRAAQNEGAAVANYVEALEPLWNGKQIAGFRVRDLEQSQGREEWKLRAHRTVVCTGPWTDQIGEKLSKNWRRWLNPSKGIHLLFDLKKLPLPGAMVMSHPQDGRVAFVIPRSDYGTGVVIVGTTDGPTPRDPDQAEITRDDVQYLMGLLTQYFPTLKLTTSDILSAYVGVRPLMGNAGSSTDGQGPSASPENVSDNGDGSNQTDHSGILQKVSREHHIALGPGGTVIVAGGKYTTHRKMAEEIVDFALETWGDFPKPSHSIQSSRTRAPVNPQAIPESIQRCREEALQKGMKLPEELLGRYGAEALSIYEDANHLRGNHGVSDPAGFPCLLAQLRHSIRTEMVLHLEDFYLRRIPLYATRKDRGLPWAEALAQVWAEERGLNQQDVKKELELLREELDRRSQWQQQMIS